MPLSESNGRAHGRRELGEGRSPRDRRSFGSSRSPSGRPPLRTSSRQIVAALVLGLSLATACNGIVGLSDYSRGECSGGGLCFDAGMEAFLDAGDALAQPLDASGTRPVAWAKFVMPNFPQDGGPGENIPTYTTSSGAVQDSVSKLVWREPIEPGLKSYEEALKICATGAAGEAWRLPSRIELVTLLDLDPNKSPKIDTQAFPSTEPFVYWTSSEVRPDVGGERRHWTVDFMAGGLGQLSLRDGRAGVRCIKDR